MKSNTTAHLEKTVNGVDVEKLGQTVEAIKEKPSIGEFRFRAKNKWVGGSVNRSEIKDFYGAGQEHEYRAEPYVLTNDEAPILLGGDTGPNPVEYLLNALAGCLTTTMVYQAAAQGIEIEEIESELEGDLDLQGFLKLDPSIRPGFRNISANFKVKSNASADQLAQLAKTSPVYDSICNPVSVHLAIEKK